MMKNNYNRWLTSVAFALAIALVSPLTLSSCGNKDDIVIPDEENEMNDGMAQELKGAMNNEVEKMPEGRDAEERAEQDAGKQENAPAPAIPSIHHPEHFLRPSFHGLFGFP